MDEKIVIGKNGVKYQNRYVIKSDICELHITDNKTSDTVIIIDIDDVDKMKDHYWICCLSGHKDYKRPQVFSAISKTKRLYLHKYILGDNSSAKILFINRDPYDYRKRNLQPYDNGIQYRDRNKHNVKGMNNIREITYKDHLVSYQVTFRQNDKQKTKVFNIEKLGGKKTALKMAKAFRDQFI